MKKFSHRIGKLETRITKRISNDEDYLEIVQWHNEETCMTIAIFYKYDEGHYLQSVGDRVILEPKDWVDFGVLVRSGFEFLDLNDSEEIEE